MVQWGYTSKSTDSITDLRLQLLENGYTPLANRDKRCLLKQWPTLDITPERIRSWKRMRRFSATGLRVENGLAVIDLDIDHPILGDIAADLEKLIPNDEAMCVRTGKGHKEAWFVRTTELFSRIHTRKWTAPNDHHDTSQTHCCEIFGGLAVREFGVYGAHSIDVHGRTLLNYAWLGHHPATQTLASLPELSKDTFFALADCVEHYLETAGFTPVKLSASGESEATRLYTLTDDMRFEMLDGRSLDLDELKAVVAQEDDLRCSASWLEGPTAVNRTRCLISTTHLNNIAIWETASGTTHLEKDKEPDQEREDSVDRLAEQLRELEDRAENRRETDDNLNTAAAKALTTYAFCANQKNNIVPIWANNMHEGMTITAFRNLMLPWSKIEIGPKGGQTRLNPADIWTCSKKRVSVEGMRLRPDMPRPVYEENGDSFINIYAPPVHIDADKGSTKVGFEFFEQLLPDETERTWFLTWLAHKYRQPGIPGPGIVMIATHFGAGRGTLGILIQHLFGAEYVTTVPFSVLTGKTYQSQYTDWAAHTLIALVNESAESTGSVYRTKANTYEHLKELVEPRPQLRFYTRKGEANFSAMSYTSYIVATQHRDALPLPANDRRFAVLTNGEPRSETFWERINKWLRKPANIAAFAEYLTELDLGDYNPFAVPLMTDAKRDMAALAQSDIERAFSTAVDEMPGRVMTINQIIAAMISIKNTFGYDYPDQWQKIAKRIIRSRLFRVNGVRPQMNSMRQSAYADRRDVANRWAREPARTLRSELMKNESEETGANNILTFSK